MTIYSTLGFVLSTTHETIYNTFLYKSKTFKWYHNLTLPRQLHADEIIYCIWKFLTEMQWHQAGIQLLFYEKGGWWRGDVEVTILKENFITLSLCFLFFSWFLKFKGGGGGWWCWNPRSPPTGIPIDLLIIDL